MLYETYFVSFFDNDVEFRIIEKVHLQLKSFFIDYNQGSRLVAFTYLCIVYCKI